MRDESGKHAKGPWEIFRFFLGRWTGIGSGKPGESRVEREYKRVLNDQFIQITDRAVYPPQERNPEGEVHEEIGYISYDRNRGKYVLREFHVEGYVNQYVLEDLETEGKRLVFRRPLKTSRMAGRPAPRTRSWAKTNSGRLSIWRGLIRSGAALSRTSSKGRIRLRLMSSASRNRCWHQE